MSTLGLGSLRVRHRGPPRLSRLGRCHAYPFEEGRDAADPVRVLRWPQGWHPPFKPLGGVTGRRVFASSSGPPPRCVVSEGGFAYWQAQGRRTVTSCEAAGTAVYKGAPPRRDINRLVAFWRLPRPGAMPTMDALGKATVWRWSSSRGYAAPLRGHTGLAPRAGYRPQPGQSTQTRVNR